MNYCSSHQKKFCATQCKAHTAPLRSWHKKQLPKANEPMDFLFPPLLGRSGWSQDSQLSEKEYFADNLEFLTNTTITTTYILTTITSPAGLFLQFDARKYGVQTG
jgi:hypothetical protein